MALNPEPQNEPDETIGYSGGTVLGLHQVPSWLVRE